MAALVRPPPRTPSPKIKIYRSQSFDSPSSRISVTPIDDSPYSKSTSFIPTYAQPLPRYDILKGRPESDDEIMSDESYSSDGSSGEDSPTSTDRFGLFGSGSPPPPRYNSPLLSPPLRPNPLIRTHSRNNTLHQHVPSPHHRAHLSASPPIQVQAQPPQILSSTLHMSIYQDPDTPSFDPWLVRVVLDLFDVRGFDWMDMAEVIMRVWGRRTGSAEVLGILCGNGRMSRGVWWD